MCGVCVSGVSVDFVFGVWVWITVAVRLHSLCS